VGGGVLRAWCENGEGVTGERSSGIQKNQKKKKKKTPKKPNKKHPTHRTEVGKEWGGRGGG